MPRLPATPKPPAAVASPAPVGPVAAAGATQVAPATPLGTIPFSTAEEDIAFAPLLTDEQKTQLAQVPGSDRTKLRDLSRSIRNINTQSGDLKTRRDELTREWLVHFERSGLGAVPCVDAVTRQPLLAYKRADEMLHVEVVDLREFLYEHFKIVKGEEEDLAIIHANDIMEQVLQPPKIDNEAFKRLVDGWHKAGQQDLVDAASAATTITTKAPYVAFQKPNQQRK